MLRSSTLETPPATAPVAGATDVVEAPTAEAAIAAVHDLLGPDARIIDAQRVLRGGIGGFFSKEVVQLHAAAGTPPAAPAAPAARATASAPSPWDAVLRSDAGRATEPDVTPVEPTLSPVDRLLGDVAEVPDTIDFATFLRRQLADDTTPGTTDGPCDDAPEASSAAAETPAAEAPVARTVGVPAAPDTVRCEPTPADDGGPPWSVAALLALGLPVELVRGLEVADPSDDLAWTSALAEALRPSCRPLPSGPAVMLGPNAHLVSEVDGTPAARSETWLKALRDGRWLHLVVGGDGWRAPLAEHPLAASWARPQDLPDALRCAVELGLVLGYGPLGGAIRRARPLDVALAVRDLVDGR